MLGYMQTLQQDRISKHSDSTLRRGSSPGGTGSDSGRRLVVGGRPVGGAGERRGEGGAEPEGRGFREGGGASKPEAIRSGL